MFICIFQIFFFIIKINKNYMVFVWSTMMMEEYEQSFFRWFLLSIYLSIYFIVYGRCSGVVHVPPDVEEFGYRSALTSSRVVAVILLFLHIPLPSSSLHLFFLCHCILSSSYFTSFYFFYFFIRLNSTLSFFSKLSFFFIIFFQFYFYLCYFFSLFFVYFILYSTK